MNKIKIFFVGLITLCTLSLAAKDYKASLFGAKSDGLTLNTRSIQYAVNFISENGGGRLVFYVGRYLTGNIQLKSNVTIQLEEGAVLVGTASIYDYSGFNGRKALISANHQQNIGITGKGVIDGQGPAILDNIRHQISNGYIKESMEKASPLLISLDSCKNVAIDQINLMNACGTVQSYSECKDLTISKITVKSTIVPGSKAIIFNGCDGVKLTDSFFETSGKELTILGKSKNISIVNCINAKGKKIK